MVSFPAHFVRTQTDLHGADGLAWLERLPGVLDSCARRWDLTLGSPLEPLTYNYVAAARRADGTPVIVKACTPSGEFNAEAEALRLFAGRGAVRLLEIDHDESVMLLERCAPGVMLRTVTNDEEATVLAASVMKRLWRPVPPEHPFKSIGDWGQGFQRLRQHYGGTCGPFPRPLLEEAEELFAALSASMDAPVLLHGDLHHDNMLASGRGWLAIDPKGVIGEPAYETGALLRNPHPDLLAAPHPDRILARRVDLLAGELGLDRARIRGWGVAQAVLSAWWSVEDFGQPSEEVLTCARLLAAIKVA